MISIHSRGVALEFAELSDPGRDPSKQVNEDSSGHADTALGFLSVVCDGMGGHVGGKMASNTAIASIVGHVRALGGSTSPYDALHGAITRAAQDVYEVGGDTPIEMRPGSTCVALLLHEGRAEIAHVGDSRAYLIRQQNIHRLTRDHSMVQQMVDAGVITQEQASGHPDANRITRALGMLPDVDVELALPPLTLQAEDLLLLCSDGLSDLVEDQDISAVVREWLNSGIAVVCQRLVEVANARGGYDNITVQLLRILDIKQQLKPTVVDETPPHSTEVPAVSDPSHHSGDTHPMMDADPAESKSAAVGRPAPTLIEEPTASMEAPYLSGAHQPVESLDRPTRPSFDPRRRADSRVLMFVALAASALVMLGVALWWLIVGNGPRERPSDSTEAPSTGQMKSSTDGHSVGAQRAELPIATGRLPTSRTVPEASSTP